VRYLEKNK